MRSTRLGHSAVFDCRGRVCHCMRKSQTIVTTWPKPPCCRRLLLTPSCHSRATRPERLTAFLARAETGIRKNILQTDCRRGDVGSDRFRAAVGSCQRAGHRQSAGSAQQRAEMVFARRDEAAIGAGAAEGGSALGFIPRVHRLLRSGRDNPNS